LIKSRNGTKVKLKPSKLNVNYNHTNLFLQQQLWNCGCNFHTSRYHLYSSKFDDSHINDHEEPLSHLSVEVNQKIPTNGYQLSISVATKLFQLYTKLL